MADNRRAAAVAELEGRLGHAFADRALLERALTHASVSQGQKRVDDSERLEFLGDRVLNLVVAEALMDRHPAEREGDLSKRMHGLVDRRTCATVARGLGVGPALRLPGGETKRGAREQDTFLADAMEALIAAVYLEGGLEVARALVLREWSPAFESAPAPGAVSPKSRLQEWAAASGRPIPRYDVLERQGPDHAPRFRVAVAVEGLEPASASGGSIREAEVAAAQALLQREAVA